MEAAESQQMEGCLQLLHTINFMACTHSSWPTCAPHGLHAFLIVCMRSSWAACTPHGPHALTWPACTLHDRHVLLMACMHFYGLYVLFMASVHSSWHHSCYLLTSASNTILLLCFSARRFSFRDCLLSAAE